MLDEHSVDFLKKKYQLAPTRQSTRRFGLGVRIGILCLAISACTAMAFSWNIARTQESFSVPESAPLSFFSAVRRLVGSDDKNLVGESDDRVNILLLGVGGAGHDGSELTDTILFGSFQPSTKQVGILSIPRDLAVPVNGYYQKINSVNAYAEQKEDGSGLEATTSVVSDLLQQPVHYTVKVDFDGFQDLIDAVGGIDVYVERSFTDTTYPSDELGNVKTVSFTEGQTHMDGATALIYARSRHGTNGEGSDFARSRRQQKILLSLKDRILSPSVILSPGKLNRIIDTFSENVTTNMSVWEMAKFAKYAPDITTENVRVHVLDDAPGSPLYSAHINGAYVLLPKSDDWSDIHDIASNLFTEGSVVQDGTITASNTQTAKESVAIEIQNGTARSGLAFQTSQLLSTSGFSVVHIGNAESRDYTETIIYDLTGGKKADELAILKQFLEADVSMTPSGWVYSDAVVPRELTLGDEGMELSTSDEPIDFLVILGEDAANLVMR